MPLGIFALLENGCREVYVLNGNVIGLEADDPPDTAEDDVARLQGGMLAPVQLRRYGGRPECPPDERPHRIARREVPA